MQTHGGADAEKAILSSERDITISLRVDWNGDGQFSHVMSDLTPFVSNISTDRSLSGSSPNDVLLVEGNAAAELQATLGGDYQGLQLPAVFSPFNSQSPLYQKVLAGADVEYDIVVRSPLGEFVYPQFRGFVRTVTPDRLSNQVTLTALDRAEVLRRPVQLPPWALPEQHLAYGEAHSLAIYGSWVIDHCLRLCDVSPTPYRPTFWEELNVPDYGLDGVQVYVTGNGGYLPTVGWLDNMNANTFPNPGHNMYYVSAPRHPGAVGVYGLSPLGLNGLGDNISSARTANSEGYLHYWSLDRDKIRTRSSHFMGLTINRVGGPNLNNFDEIPLLEVVIGGHYYLYIMIEDGQVWTRRRYAPPNGSAVNVDTGRIDIPDGDNIDVYAAWDNNGSDLSGTRAWIGVRLSGTTTWIDEFDEGWPYYDLSSPVDPPDDFEPWRPGINTDDDDLGDDHIKGRVRIGQAVGMSDIFYATRNWYGATIQGLENSSIRRAKYPALLDLSNNRLGYTPTREARDAWDIICDVAGAELGSVFFDETGLFQFWNWDTMLEKQEEPVRTFTLDEIEGLNLTTSLDSIRNVITVQAGVRRAIWGCVYSLDDLDLLYAPPGATIERRIAVDDILSPNPFQMGEDELGDNQWRWEGVGTARFDVWNKDVDVHGHVISFYNPNRNRWEERRDIDGGYEIHQYFNGDGYLTVRLVNNWDWAIRPATAEFTYDPAHSESDSNGYRRGVGETPAYNIGGTFIKDYGEISVFSRGRDSMLKYGPRNLELKGDWYHDTTVSSDSQLIEKIRRRTEEPLPTTDAITIAGDPRLQLGDAITITDPAGFGDELTMQILGISREWDVDSGLTDTLTVHMYRVVHDAGPSNVDAGEDVFEWEVGEQFSRTATYNPGDGTDIQTQWEIIAGSDSVGVAIPPGDTVTLAVNGVGWWRLRFTVTTEFGSASDIFELHTVGGSGGGMPANPGEALWIGDDPGKNHFNVGIGQPGDGGYGDEDHLDYDMDEIEDGFEDDRYFFLNDDGNVIFRMHVENGRTTQGTKYPRSELRELDPNGSDDNDWDSSEGVHYMKGRSRVNVVPFSGNPKPEVCFTQIHDEDSDLCRVITTKGGQGAEGLRLKLLWTDDGNEDSVFIKDSYDLGEWVDWEWRFVDGQLTFYLNGENVWSEYLPKAGCYFKTGCYNQVNNREDGGNADEGDYCEVEMEKGSLVVWHTGYPEPTTPSWSGGGGDNGDGDGGTGEPGSFGNDSGNAGFTGSGIAKKKVSRAVATGTGTVQSLTVRGAMEFAGESTSLRGVIYSNSGNAPDDLLAVTETIEIDSSSTQEWTASFTGGNQIEVTEGTTYWIGVHWDAPTNGRFNISRGTSVAVAPVNEDDFGDGPSDPFGSFVQEAGPIDCWVDYGIDEGFAAKALRTVDDQPPSRFQPERQEGRSIRPVRLRPADPTVQVDERIDSDRRMPDTPPPVS